jgi:Mg/Co/Ni transporter MgtE
VEELAPAEREAIFETLDESKAADALTEVEPKVQRSIIEALDSEKAADILEEMAPDEAADLLAELPQETSEGILDDMEAKEAEEIEELLEYKEDTAGGMMNPDFIAVPQSGTVDTAIAALRANREVAATVNTVFVTDGENRLTGSIPLVDLFLASPSALLHEIKPPRLLFAHLDSSEKDVIELFDKYNLLSLPVVDELYRIDGVITVDDIISVLRAKK